MGRLVGSGPFEARAVVVDKAGKTATAHVGVILMPLAPPDAGARDAGTRDAGARDAAGPEGPDAGLDAGPLDAAVAVEDAGRPPSAEPVRLAQPEGCAMHATRRTDAGGPARVAGLILASCILRRRRGVSAHKR